MTALRGKPWKLASVVLLMAAIAGCDQLGFSSEPGAQTGNSDSAERGEAGLGQGVRSEEGDTATPPAAQSEEEIESLQSQLRDQTARASEFEASTEEGLQSLRAEVASLDSSRTTSALLAYLALGAALLALGLAVYGLLRLSAKSKEMAKRVAKLSDRIDGARDEFMYGLNEAKVQASEELSKSHSELGMRLRGISNVRTAQAASPRREPDPVQGQIPARAVENFHGADSLVSEPVPAPTAPVQSYNAQRPAIAFDRLQPIIAKGGQMMGRDFRQALSDLGVMDDVDIRNRQVMLRDGPMDAGVYPLVAVFDQQGLGYLVPSKDYLKDFPSAYMKIRNPVNDDMVAPFFDLEKTKTGTLNYDAPCIVQKNGREISVIQRGRLSGFFD